MNRQVINGFFLPIFLSALLSSNVYSADVKITISGKVTAAACTINNSGTYSILMNDVTAATMNPLGSYGEWANFDVTLSNCPVGTSRVVATFKGVQDSIDTKKYANATGAGYATNVSVQVQNRSGTIEDKGNDSTMSAPVGTSKNVTFDLRARPYSSTGGGTVGNISTVVMMNFDYN